MAVPGAFQPFLGRTISIIKVKEVRGGELHVMLNTSDTLRDHQTWYIYRRPTGPQGLDAQPAMEVGEDEAQRGLVVQGFGTETDPHGHTRLVGGDGRSPSIVERDHPERFRHLPNFVLAWLWLGLSLTQLTMRYICRHARSRDATTVSDGAAQWCGKSVRAAIDEQRTVYYLGTEAGENFEELVFDKQLRNLCLPTTFTPLPRHIAQWLASEAVRLGMEVLDLNGAF